MTYERLFENFDNVDKPLKCEVIGTPPSFLKGTMVRNGPGMFSVGDTKYNHWFDGLAYIQRYHFENGQMFYSAKYLESEQYKDDMEKQRIVHSSFGTYRFPDPCKTIFQRFLSFFSNDEKADNCVVAFSQIGDAVYALTETPFMVRVDLDTLDVKDTVNVTDYVSLHTYTAHHQSDKDGNIFNIGSRFGKGGCYCFAETKNPKNIENAADGSIEATSLIGTMPFSNPYGPAYYHSFGLSENFAVLLECPVRLDMKKLIIRKAMGYSFRETMFWDDSLGVNVLVLDRKTGKKIDLKVKAESFFVFHHANTFEKENFLVFDYCKVRNAGNFEDLLLEHMKSGQFSTRNPDLMPYLHRMIVPTTIPDNAKPGEDLLKDCSFARGCTAILKEDGSVEVSDRRICEQPFEFPRYNYERNNMTDYRYVYGSSLLNPTNSLAGIVKADVTNDEFLVWNRENTEQLCAEPIFVANPEAEDEDDGILIVPVLTLRDGDHPFVVILSARDLTEVCRYSIPQSRLPLGFHAHYVQRN